MGGASFLRLAGSVAEEARAEGGRVKFVKQMQ